uniref:VASt domain-containing protein n=1 Tax=Caenorhabditis tropicalis TaxID=1561998 RepID=A0A1I7UNJ2_9PELO
MLPIVGLFVSFLMETAVASQVFSEDVGKVTVLQNSCSVMPHRVWKRFEASPKPLKEYSPESIKFLMTWVHSTHGVESRLEDMMLKWDEQSICFDRPTTLPLKKVAHGGSFSSDSTKFSYLEVPEYWIAPKEDDLDTWKNVKIEECSTTNDVSYRCPESAVKDVCSQKDLEKCSERIEMDSSEDFWTFVRRLGSSHIVATKARRGSIIRNGNVFDIKPVDIPERIFKVTLTSTDMMSIGSKLLKN